MIGSFFLLFLSAIFNIFIAVILILEHATILSSSGNQEAALQQAQLQYIQLGMSISAVQFPAAFENYTDTEFIQFILNNRLPVKQVLL